MSEEYMLEMIESYPFSGKGKIALDIGANKGDYTELLASKFDKVYAIEPLPENIEDLKERFKDNPKVTIIPKAISHKAGTAKLYLNGKDTEASLSKIFAQSGAWNYRTDNFMEVETITLDDYFSEHAREIGFMKVDVEGAEHNIFKSAQSLFRNLEDKTAWIALEAHLLVDWDEVNALFTKHGFKFLEDGFKRVEEMTPGSHYLIHKGELKFKRVLVDE